MRDITERKRIELAMRERVRELDCLYGVSRLVEKPGISLDELLQGVASLLAQAMQRAEVSGARVRFGGREYRTPDWEDTTLRIQEPLRVNGVETGAVELGYLPDIGKPGLLFLPEEHNLLFAVATRLARTLERLHAADVLRESEKRFHDVALCSGDWVWELDAQGRYTYCSERVQQVLGYEPGELLGRMPFDLMPDDEAARTARNFAALAADASRSLTLRIAT